MSECPHSQLFYILTGYRILDWKHFLSEFWKCCMAATCSPRSFSHRAIATVPSSPPLITQNTFPCWSSAWRAAPLDVCPTCSLPSSKTASMNRPQRAFSYPWVDFCKFTLCPAIPPSPNRTSWGLSFSLPFLNTNNSVTRQTFACPSLYSLHCSSPPAKM